MSAESKSAAAAYSDSPSPEPRLSHHRDGEREITEGGRCAGDAAPSTAAYDLADLREAAENDGEGIATTYIGGPGWEVVRALIAVVDAANNLTLVKMPRPTGNRTPEAFYPAFDKLLSTLEPFENRGDDA